MNFEGKDIISMNDLTRGEIDTILDKVETVRNHPRKKDLCSNKIGAMLFFEPSTRTRTSFEVAMRNLGGKIGGFYDERITSAVKEESLWDTVKMHDAYGFDVMVIRHPLKGAARLAAEATDIPVINAGDGPNQHPTQTLLDLYSIKETQQRLDGLTIAMVGDLAYGRTVHSLTEALLKYDGCSLIFISPRDLAMPRFLIDKCRKASDEGRMTFAEGVPHRGPYRRRGHSVHDTHPKGATRRNNRPAGEIQANLPSGGEHAQRREAHHEGDASPSPCG